MKAGRSFSVSASLFAGVVSVTPVSVGAQAVAPSYEAAPEVYKLISENEQFRVILATWKPGQRDAWHSHAGSSVAYYLTDCSSRFHTPDGKTTEVRSRRAGEVGFGPSTASHSFENVGTTECKVVLVERK